MLERDLLNDESEEKGAWVLLEQTTPPITTDFNPKTLN